ncbi:MAG: amidohydrolase family protein [Thermodesulfobacteriota bacterium]
MSLGVEGGREAGVLVLDFEPGVAYVLRVGEVWPGPGLVRRPGWVRVESGRIAGLGYGLPPTGPGLEFLELGPVLLTPALLDAHVHLGLTRKKGLDLAGRSALAAGLGLAAVRDGGDKDGAALRLRDRIEEHLYLAASGAALHAPGRYGSFLGRAVADRAGLAAAVKELALAGADQIKVLASGPVGLEAFGRTGGPQFSAADLAWLVELAGDRGLKVMAHANGPQAVKMCLKAGAASLEHGYFMGEANLELLAETGAAWVPTIAPLAALAEGERDRERRSLLERIIADQVARLARAREFGIRAVPGSDAGSPGVAVGPGLYSELSWWRQAGWTLDEILAAATAGASALLGLGQILGRLAEGRPAFLAGFPLASALAGPPVFVGRPAGSRPGWTRRDHV